MGFNSGFKGLIKSKTGGIASGVNRLMLGYLEAVLRFPTGLIPIFSPNLLDWLCNHTTSYSMCQGAI